jgi:hypothetical protein
MKIKSVQIGEFLKSLNEGEYQFLKLTMNVLEGIKSLIEEHGISKEEILKEFELKEDGYENFIKGNYAYSISHLATINHLLFVSRMEKLKDNPPFQVAKGNL